ncbi:thiol reductant ABC exporter subunit CydC [Paraburkholderia lycopersici]|uniref:ATP-binding cassette, subfamily C, CydC n=1 Tax=Paraburkholderia lycopersici TaxID=416944 RepID=A0A1G6PNA6_9BURK|nr:thiol reductant ABC exporter subunit CydC [Paraburkholderia lycopersici]SDC81461.1 ATP-binding cassette, subfamily C, CydC [Paraburkholderia lycopersici]
MKTIPRTAQPATDDRAVARADLRRLLALFRPYWSWMAAGAALSLATVLANVALMAVAGWFIASMALAGVTHLAFDYFTPAALIRACAIVRTGGRYLERLVTHEATLRLLARLRVWFYVRIEPLAPAGLGRLRGADLAMRIQSDIDSLSNLYLRALVPVVAGGIGTLVIVAMVSAYSLPVAAVALLFLLLAGAVLPCLGFASTREPARAGIALRAELHETVVDSLQGLGELQVYGAAPAYARKVDQLSGQLVGQQRKLSDARGISQGALVACASVAMWCALLLAVPRLASPSLSPADVAMLAFLVLASFEAVMPIPTALQLVGESLAAARRIFDLADASPPVQDPPAPLPLTAQNDLVVRHLGFRYDDTLPWVLRDLSFDLPAGGRLAIVGASGAGKSTLVQLLLRFLEYPTGSIELGGVELRECAAEAVRARIAVVSQDTYLFNDTIRANLLIARPDADQASLEAACRDAQLHEFICGLPQGYDTPVGEAGARLSGGQARRLAIARALLRDAPILVLDEPTEGLDTVTGQALMSAIVRLMAGRSVVLITHELTDVSREFDRILVLEGSRETH